jgi:hypothetical protein
MMKKVGRQCVGPKIFILRKLEKLKLSILKRIEEIVLATESRLRNVKQSEANSSNIPNDEPQPSREKSVPQPDREMEFELVEC